jgi:acyl carrier protein
MTNLEKYNQILKRDLRAGDDDLNDGVLIYNRFQHWDSMAHMEMVSDLEEAFHVQFETLDITSFDKYSAGIEILRKLGVKI